MSHGNAHQNAVTTVKAAIAVPPLPVAVLPLATTLFVPPVIALLLIVLLVLAIVRLTKS